MVWNFLVKKSIIFAPIQTLYAMEKFLEGFNKKDRKHWKQFYEDYYSALCAYINKFVKDNAASEDIVQDTFINIWNSQRIFPTEQELTWYVYKASYTNALYYLRKKNLHQQLVSRQLEEEEWTEEDFVSTVREELIRHLFVYIKELPPKAQKIIQLSLEGYSGNEIAKILGISIHTVKSQKNRSLRFLKENLVDTLIF